MNLFFAPASPVPSSDATAARQQEGRSARVVIAMVTAGASGGRDGGSDGGWTEWGQQVVVARGWRTSQ